MRKQNRNAGVITLEAAIMMPLFILLMLFLYAFFIFFMGQQIMSHTAIQTAKSLSFDPYIVNRVNDDDLATMIVDITEIFSGKYSSTDKWYTAERSDRLQGVAKDRFLAFLPNQSDPDALLEWVGVENGTAGLDFSGSAVEDGVLTLKIQYVQNYAFKLADLTSFDRVITLKAKLFDWK